MKYKLKIIGPGKEQVREDEIHANSDEEVHEIYKLMGQKVEILGKENLGSKPPSLLNDQNNRNPNSIPTTIPMPPLIKEPLNLPPPPEKVKPKETIFKDNGMSFKVIDGKLFKKDWVKVISDDLEEYKVKGPDNKELGWGEYNLYKKEWIELNNED